MHEVLLQAKNDKRNNPIKSNWKTMKVIRELRNIITHETDTKLSEIAEPSEELVNELRGIVEQYQHPKKIS